MVNASPDGVSLLVLPLPPTVNQYWRRSTKGGKPSMRKSDEAMHYRTRVAGALLSQGNPAYGSRPMVVQIFVHCREGKQAGDIDNYAKGILDALEAGGVFANDSQVIDLRQARRASVPNGCVVVELVPATTDEIRKTIEAEPETEILEAEEERRLRYGW